MFGYIVADLGNLSEEEKKCYNKYYCGLCHALKKTNGNLGRLTLTYDFTFIALLLCELYGEKSTVRGKCAPHPCNDHEYVVGGIMDYVADMNVLLSYVNMIDDWEDDGNILAFMSSRFFEGKIRKIRARFQERYDTVFECISLLSEAERRGESNPDIPASAFGKLLGSLLCYRRDKYEKVLFDFGFALGRYVYLQDACIDFKKDLKKERYNPLSEAREEDFDDILNMLAADCAAAFEKIDVVRDNGLIKNIIYSGIRLRYSEAKSRETRKK